MIFYCIKLVKRISYSDLFFSEETVNVFCFFFDVFIGKRSEPPSDKLGGEIYISKCMVVCLSPYIYTIYGVRTARQPSCPHALCVHTHTCS